MIEYRQANEEDIDLLMDTRLEMIRDSNGLPDNFVFDKRLVESAREYFLKGDQSTILAMVDGEFVGCASVSYVTYMPTFAHPTGKRAHLTNVYTRKAYRRQGIASRLVTMLMNEAWERGVTEINLYATDAGRPLYRKLGFEDSTECMSIERELT